MIYYFVQFYECSYLPSGLRTLHILSSNKNSVYFYLLSDTFIRKSNPICYLIFLDFQRLRDYGQFSPLIRVLSMPY